MLLSYAFTLIADNGPESPFRDFRFNPTTNNEGTVAFQAELRSGGEAVYTRDVSDRLRTIAITSDLVRSFLGSPTINDAGRVAFLADLREGGQALLSGAGQSLIRIADTDPLTSPFGSLVGIPFTMNNNGTVAFRATLRSGGNGIFTGGGGSTSILYVTGGSYSGFGSEIAINNQGTVAFYAILNGGTQGILIGNGGPTSTAATAGDPFVSFSLPAALNDANTIAFVAALAAGGQAILTSNDTGHTSVVTTGSVFSDFGGPRGSALALNNSGQTAFYARLAGGGSGIFHGPDPINDRIIAIGDSLFGSTVTAFADSSFLAPKGLNDLGQVAFVVDLADGRRVVVRADPCIVSLEPNATAGHRVGEPVTWSAMTYNWPDTPVYQFSAGPIGGPYQVVRDYSPANTFTWTPMHEGLYDVRVIVKSDYYGLRTESVIASYLVNSRVTGSSAVISPTANPLVALYSAPPTNSATVFVEFALAGDSPTWRTTPTLAGGPGTSTNFLVAGLLPDTTYQMRHVLDDGTTSAPLLFTTGSLPSNLTFPNFTVQQAPAPGSDLSEEFVFHMLIGAGAQTVRLLATDLLGRVTWYYDPAASGLSGINTTSIVVGGTVLLLGNHPSSGSVLREIDLAGNPLRETNREAVNTQLTQRGQRLISGFHHDAQRLPNGYTAVLAYIGDTFDLDGTPMEFLGDMVIVLDEDFQVVWTWDAFDHLDVNRGLVSPADWTHSNAIAWSPADENLVISIRHQDWLVKIDYRGGTGDGHVVWRLGEDGDFTTNSADPYPWFSHQHDPRYIDDTTLVLFDNGNRRVADDPDGHSRGQMWRLNEQTGEATLLLNADLGNYSAALGGAQRLASGNFVFTSGFQGSGANRFGQSIEVLADGTVVYVLEVASLEYRSLRLSTLYGQG